jgi:hypothetical protein
MLTYKGFGALAREHCEDLFLRVRGRFIPEGLQSARATARIQYEYGPSSERVETPSATKMGPSALAGVTAG